MEEEEEKKEKKDEEMVQNCPCCSRQREKSKS